MNNNNTNNQPVNSNTPPADTPDIISQKEIINTILNNVEEQNKNQITTNVTTITGATSITIIEEKTIPVVDNKVIEVIPEIPITNNEIKTDIVINIQPTEIKTSEVSNIPVPEPIKPSSLVTSVILNSLNNEPVDGVNVYLLKGNRQSVNNALELKRKTSYSSDPSVISSTISDIHGNFGFADLGPNKYTLIFEKDGFYTAVECI
jgi:hypothetical protein